MIPGTGRDVAVFLFDGTDQARPQCNRPPEREGSSGTGRLLRLPGKDVLRRRLKRRRTPMQSREEKVHQARRQQTKALAATLALLVFVIGVSSPVTPRSDSKYVIYQAVSLIRHGDMDLNEYPNELRFFQFQNTLEVDGHVYDAFPSGMVYIATPFVWLFSTVYGFGYVQGHAFAFELIIASLLTSMASALLFLALRPQLPPWKAVIVASITTFGSPMLSTASRALWQQTGSIFLICAFLFLSTRLTDAGGRRKYVLGLIGILVALAFETRPLNITWIVPSAMIVFYGLKRKAHLIYLVGPMALLTVSFIFLHDRAFHSWLHPYAQPGRIFHFETMGEAIAGNLISPGRGLFAWSPVFLFSLFAGYRLVKERAFTSYDGAFLTAVLLHLLLISSFPHWWGGHSVGPRLMTETAPFLGFLLTPFVGRIRPAPALSLVLGFALLASISIAIHLRSVYLTEVREWNVKPENVDTLPGRVWDAADPQFLRSETGVRTLLKLPADLP